MSEVWVRTGRLPCNTRGNSINLSREVLPTLSHLQDTDARVERQPLLKVNLPARLLLLNRPLHRKVQLTRYPLLMASVATERRQAAAQRENHEARTTCRVRWEKRLPRRTTSMHVPGRIPDALARRCTAPNKSHTCELLCRRQGYWLANTIGISSYPPIYKVVQLDVCKSPLLQRLDRRHLALLLVPLLRTKLWRMERGRDYRAHTKARRARGRHQKKTRVGVTATLTVRAMNSTHNCCVGPIPDRCTST